MRKETRSLDQTNHVAFARAGSGYLMTVSGHNKKGKAVTFKIKMDWTYLPYVIRDILKVWIEEKTSRLSIIKRVDSAFEQQDTTTKV